MIDTNKITLGTVQFGMPYGLNGPDGGVATAVAKEVLELAWAAGIRRLDTAPGYGRAEEIIVELAGGRPFEITTKLPALQDDLSECAQEEWVSRHIRTSASRLGSGLSRVLFHHASDLEGPSANNLWSRAQSECDTLGLTLGVSSYDPSQVERLARKYPIAAAQLPGNAFDQRLASAALPRPIELEVRSVFLQGLLLGDVEKMAEAVPSARSALRDWAEWCTSHAMSRAVAALSIVSGFAPKANLVVGLDDPEQLHDLLEAAAVASPMRAPEIAVSDPAVFRPDQWAVRG